MGLVRNKNTPQPLLKGAISVEIDMMGHGHRWEEQRLTEPPVVLPTHLEVFLLVSNIIGLVS